MTPPLTSKSPPLSPPFLRRLFTDMSVKSIFLRLPLVHCPSTSTFHKASKSTCQLGLDCPSKSTVHLHKSTIHLDPLSIPVYCLVNFIVQLRPLFIYLHCPSYVHYQFKSTGHVQCSYKSHVPCPFIDTVYLSSFFLNL